MQKLLLLIIICLAGCTIPAKIFFQNLSSEKVRLQCTLVDRRQFDKLPNKVDFFETTTMKKQTLGVWKARGFVAWLDTTTFYIDVPAHTGVDVADISRGLVVGARHPSVLLLLIAQGKIDTLTTGDYSSLAAKFKATGYGVFRSPVYYYNLN